ncbi:phage protein [Ureibacillus suwonensis]|uniref:Phage protein n=1 Tax=Ureibacillus suwonensis TaxID=313007 RepID=A0ABW0RBI5_9BACL
MSKLFKRYIEVLTGNLRFNNTDLDIEFDIPFDDDLEPNLSEIVIYNLSESTRNKLKRGQTLTINAGYVEDKGLILSGSIEAITTVKNGADLATTIKVLDSVPYDATKTLQKSYKKNIKSDAVIRDLAQSIGLKIAVLNLPDNKVMTDGYSIDGEVVKAINDIATDCGASAYISRGQIYVRPIKEGDNHNFILKADTGLIGSPEYFEEEKNGTTIKGYKVKSLLQYRMNTASIIKLESQFVKATVRVRKGRHYARGNDFYTEVEAVL